EKVARVGWISNVFRIAGSQSAEQSVGIRGQKVMLFHANMPVVLPVNLFRSYQIKPIRLYFSNDL
ncbi:MAG TPA: hypothetical protein DCX82_17085, partial [Lachnospiraceae bacterium]|nr:hypothetical protein [Lachnospiraceae bacterium]